jgi:hypothetical protein
MKEGGAKQRYSSDTMFGFQKRKWNVWAYFLGGGIASRHPRTTQHIKNAKTAERVTISHWPRTTTGLSTGVRGTENAGTAFTSLNCLCTTLLSMRVRVCCGKSRCGREEESRLSRGRRGTFSSGCASSVLPLRSWGCAGAVQRVTHLDCKYPMRAIGDRRSLGGVRTSSSVLRRCERVRTWVCGGVLNEQRGRTSKSNGDKNWRSSGNVRGGPPNSSSSSGSWSKG